MFRSKKFLAGLIICAIAAVALGIAVSSVLGSYTKKPVIEVGGEEISTLYATAGEKDMTEFKTTFEEEGESLVCTYTGVTQEEIREYMEKLTGEEGFTLTEEEEGEYRLEKPAAEEGKTVSVDISLSGAGEAKILWSVS